MTILLQQSTFWRCAAKYYRFFRFLQLSSCVMSPLTDDELLFFYISMCTSSRKSDIRFGLSEPDFEVDSLYKKSQ